MTPEEAILSLLAVRAPGATICPSEAARAVAGPEAEWRQSMDDVRAAAARLTASGVLQVTQGGQAVDVRSARGPVRLALRPKQGLQAPDDSG